MTTKELLKEIKASLIIVSVIAILGLLVAFSGKENVLNVFVISSVSYILLTALLHLLGKFIKNKYFDKLIAIVSLPLGIVYAILTAIIPFMALQIHVIYYFGISYLIPELLFRGLNYFHLIDFVKDPTITYLKITLAVFISVLFNPLLRDIIYRTSPMQLNTSEKLKPYELDKLTDYLLSTDNIRFFVYGFYVVALLVTNFHNFQGNSISNSLETDKSILQSFVTFIAFERAFTLMRQLDFKPSGLLTMVYQSILNKVGAEATDEKNNT